MNSNLNAAMFFVDGVAINVRWKPTDFSSNLQGYPRGVRKALLECGVMYCQPDEDGVRIFVSKYLDYELQALSALHEEICMGNGGGKCSLAEATVIDSIDDPQLRENFVNARIRLFTALVEDSPHLASYRETLEYLLNKIPN